MFTIFIFVFIIVHIAAEVPSYIHVCGRRDPNINQCILNSVDNLKDKICNGIPELDIQRNDPLFLDKLVLFDTPNSKLYIKDSQVTGLCDYVVNFLSTDLDNLHWDLNLSFKQIHINSTYDLNLRLLVPITSIGQVNISTDNVEAKVTVDLKLVTKNNQHYVYVSKMKINLDIKGYDIGFSSGVNLTQLQEITRNFLGNNQKEIIKSFKPVLEEAITKRIILFSNNIVKHFTYEELFPDRT